MKISKKAMLCGLAGIAGMGVMTTSTYASYDHGDGIRSDVYEPILSDGEYILCNHPDGNRAEPFYGLVLENLYRKKHGSKTWTFDFEHELSDMRMTVGSGGTEIHIFGSAMGGRDVGEEWADDSTKGVYQIDFTYDLGVGVVPGDDDLEVRSRFHNTGSITTPLDDTFDLFDKDNNDDWAFRLGDKDDDNGHRGFDGVSGWGWLKGDPSEHHTEKIKGDFLFTVKPIPAPGTAVLGGLGLMCFTGRRRRDEA